MEQFFESYGNWIVFGAMFIAMFAMHGLGIGHSGHGRGREADAPTAPTPTPDKQES